MAERRTQGLRYSRRIEGSLSLAITGLADVWSSLKRETTAPGERSGLLLMAVSAAAFSLMAAMAKLFLPTTPVQALVFTRGVLMTAFVAALARRRGVPLAGRRPFLLVLRGLLGYAALSCYFFSVQRLPLGDAVLLQYSHPAFVAALAPLLLREKSGKGHWTFVVTALLGVALIVGPSGELRSGAFVGLAGACLSGLAYMTVRDLSRTERPLTIMLWFPLATIPGSLVGTLMAGEAAIPSGPSQVAGHLLVFVTAVVGQLALTEGLTRAGAARATAVSMLGPVFGLLFGLVLFGTTPSWTSLVGTVLVIGALWKLARSKPASA